MAARPQEQDDHAAAAFRRVWQQHCHDAERIIATRRSANPVEEVIEKMVAAAPREHPRTHGREEYTAARQRGASTSNRRREQDFVASSA